jgi:transposase
MDSSLDLNGIWSAKVVGVIGMTVLERRSPWVRVRRSLSTWQSRSSRWRSRAVPVESPSASYLGLTPRARSTGSTRRLGSITKRGDVYLRMLLIHGARAVLAAAAKQREPDPLRRWALDASARLGYNKATVALAN